jgi:hypothetical protein
MKMVGLVDAAMGVGMRKHHNTTQQLLHTASIPQACWCENRTFRSSLSLWSGFSIMQNIDIHSYMHQHQLASSNSSSSAGGSAKKGGIYKGPHFKHDGPSATEEVWENQTYIPLRGWGTPYSVIAHFTDKIGEKVYSNDQFPDIPIPVG